MAETRNHVELMIYLISALAAFFARRRPDAQVCGNQFLYYEEGNPKARIAPDVYVVFGRAEPLPDAYKMWEERVPPSVIIELTSKSTRAEDTGKKRRIYERLLSVPEYFVFDPRGDYLQPRLQGYRLASGSYVRLEPEADRLHSEQLGLDLVVSANDLRLYDPAASLFLPAMAELSEREERAVAEAARLRAEIEALRRGLGSE